MSLLQRTDLIQPSPMHVGRSSQVKISKPNQLTPMLFHGFETREIVSKTREKRDAGGGRDEERIVGSRSEV